MIKLSEGYQSAYTPQQLVESENTNNNNYNSNNNAAYSSYMNQGKINRPLFFVDTGPHYKLSKSEQQKQQQQHQHRLKNSNNNSSSPKSSPSPTRKKDSPSKARPVTQQQLSRKIPVTQRSLTPPEFIQSNPQKRYSLDSHPSTAANANTSTTSPTKNSSHEDSNSSSPTKSKYRPSTVR